MTDYVKALVVTLVSLATFLLTSTLFPVPIRVKDFHIISPNGMCIAHDE